MSVEKGPEPSKEGPTKERGNPTPKPQPAPKPSPGGNEPHR